MEIDDSARELLDKAIRSHADYEQQWWKNSRRGRWVVLEPGPGSLLADSPLHIREYVDAITPRRGRRFTSLSRARAFAREVGGELRRWHRQMSRRIGDRRVKATWRYETNPWKQAARALPLWGFCAGTDP